MSSISFFTIQTQIEYSLNKFGELVGYITGNLYFCTPVIKSNLSNG